MPGKIVEDGRFDRDRGREDDRKPEAMRQERQHAELDADAGQTDTVEHQPSPDDHRWRAIYIERRQASLFELTTSVSPFIPQRLTRLSIL